MVATRPWMHQGNGSTSSSLAGMEIAIPPGQTIEDLALPPLPLEEVGIHGTKPLPPVTTRRSMASSLSSELNNAFKTPKRSVDYQDSWFDWEREEANISVVLDAPDGSADHQHPNQSQHENENQHYPQHHHHRRKQQETRPHQLQQPHRQTGQQYHQQQQRKPQWQQEHTGFPSLPKIGTTNFPSVPPDEILSPQPRTAVPKILRITGSGSPITSPIGKSPTGHNSPQKIQQLTGLDAAGFRGFDTGPSAQSKLSRHMQSLQEISSVSPISSGSLYSNRDIDTAISEPDGDPSYTRSYDGYSSDPSRPFRHRINSNGRITWVPKSPLDVPEALNIRKSHHRYSDSALSPVDVLQPAQGHESTRRSVRLPGSEYHHQHRQQHQHQHHHRRESSLGTDLYHQTAAQIARDSSDSATAAARPVSSSQASSQDSGVVSSYASHTALQPPPRARDRAPSTTSTASSSISFSLLPPAGQGLLGGARRKESFNERVQQLRVCMPPPAELCATSAGAGRGSTDTFGKDSKHPLKTPYPRAGGAEAAALKSGFDTDSDDEDSDDHRSTFARIFKRGSGGMVEITGGFSNSTSFLTSAAAAAVRAVSPSPHSASATQQERVVPVPNRARKADGPDTPFPPASLLQRTGDHFFQGLVAQAKKTARVKGRSGKERESKKNRIRVVREGVIPEGDVMPSGFEEEKRYRV